MTKGELARRIGKAAVLRGEFTLRSGRKSSYYIDKYRFETDPEILAELGKRLAEKADAETTRIAGAELGGVALAAAAALSARLPFVIVRNAKKGYGTDKAFEGRLEPGDCVLLIEDIATTGGQVIEAAKVLREAGAVVQRIVAVVDRSEGAAENIRKEGFAFESLLTREELGLSGIS